MNISPLEAKSQEYREQLKQIRKANRRENNTMYAIAIGCITLVGYLSYKADQNKND